MTEQLPGANTALHNDRDVATAPSILIVDDEAAILRLITRFLGLAGFRVEAASGVSAGLAAVYRERFDLVLCDLRMPDGSGRDFLSAALSFDPGLPVIIMSGALDEDTISSLLAAGARTILTKPVQSSVLVSVVRSHLRASNEAL